MCLYLPHSIILDMMALSMTVLALCNAAATADAPSPGIVTPASAFSAALAMMAASIGSREGFDGVVDACSTWSAGMKNVSEIASIVIATPHPDRSRGRQIERRSPQRYRPGMGVRLQYDTQDRLTWITEAGTSSTRGLKCGALLTSSLSILFVA